MTSFDQFIQVLTSLDHFGQVLANFDQFELVFQNISEEPERTFKKAEKIDFELENSEEKKSDCQSLPDMSGG